VAGGAGLRPLGGGQPRRPVIHTVTCATQIRTGGRTVSDPSERRLLTPEEYLAAQSSPEFIELKRRFRRFAFPMTVAFLTWYLAYVLLSTYAPDFMATPVIGDVNLGILLGLAQFVSTFVITHLYVWHADRWTDPIADEMRERLEAHEFARGGRRSGEADTEGASRV
jgi:uncharacterized membrane protein (DUF485 family)